MDKYYQVTCNEAVGTFKEGTSYKEIAEFFKKNWDENIKVTSQETPNDWEISFTLNGEEYVFACQTYFGDDMSYDD